MIKSLLMMIAGFVVGLLLSENAQIIRHSIPSSGNASGNINQFILIFGIGNSGNTFEINVADTLFDDDNDEKEEADKNNE